MNKCTTCNGNKMITGMGHMKEKCSKCKGSGIHSELAKPLNDILEKKPKSKKKNKD